MPQLVPLRICVAVLTQVSTPVAHEVVPATHGLGLVEQPLPAVQALQTPPLQTWFVPQVVPLGIGVAVSTHSSCPVVHEVEPWTFGIAALMRSLAQRQLL